MALDGWCNRGRPTLTNPKPTPNRRKFRFSLRTLMAVMVLLGVGLGGLMKVKRG